MGDDDDDDAPLLPNDWSMVVIRHVHDDKDCSVFPPINHENLQIFSHHHTPPSSFAPSDSDTWGLSPFDSQVRKGGDFVGWISLRLQILRSKLFAMISSFRNTGSIWSIWVPAVAVVMSWWIMMRKRRRRSLTPNETRLMNIIKEKDGRIAQLLHQIAQMNEILIARHKDLAAKVGE